jgi:hypothetical protein
MARFWFMLWSSHSHPTVNVVVPDMYKAFYVEQSSLAEDNDLTAGLTLAEFNKFMLSHTEYLIESSIRGSCLCSLALF